MSGTLTGCRSEKGFTLVELAIVMIIIGLLIAGILKGQELISNAQVAATVAQFKGYDAATTTFLDKYAARPGDMLNANARLPNCLAPACAAAAANGNGRVDSNATGFAAAPGVENIAFWLQLNAADLVSGINPTGPAVAWGTNAPAARVGGGYHMAYVDAIGDMPNTTVVAANLRAGHYLALHNTPAGAVAATGSITPSRAFRIDNKLDDGVPDAGSVVSGGAATCTQVVAGVITYNEALEQDDCNLYIRIQQ